MSRAALAFGVFLIAAPAFAGSPFYDLTEAQKRKIVVPDIKALTYCVAHVAANDQDAVGYYRNGGFGDYVGRQLEKCPREMNALLELYESTYGEGEAERFIKGPYLADLPRAVLSVIRPQLDAKVADLQADEQRVRDAEAQQEADAKRQAFVRKMQDEADAAAAEKQAELDRAATVRAEAETKAAEAKAAADKQVRINTAMGAMGVIRDRFYSCVDQQLPGLTKSGESAEVLGNAASTICGKQMADLEDSAIEVARAREDATDDGAILILREQVKSLVKERVVADAVQAKAGVGIFAASAK